MFDRDPKDGISHHAIFALALAALIVAALFLAGCPAYPQKDRAIMMCDEAFSKTTMPQDMQARCEKLYHDQAVKYHNELLRQVDKELEKAGY